MSPGHSSCQVAPALSSQLHRLSCRRCGYPDTGVCAAALLFIEFVLVGFVEGKRWADYFNPGSQGDGSFFGITDGLKGQSNGYPGGIFDPYGTPLYSPCSQSCLLPSHLSLDLLVFPPRPLSPVRLPGAQSHSP